MEILVTGISSSPGYKIALELSGHGHSVVGIYNDHPVEPRGFSVLRWDLRRDPSRPVIDHRPSVVIHTAGIGNVDLCEERRDLCYEVNTIATRELARISSRFGARFIYLSTDYVFRGTKGMYREQDIPEPINFYGLTKLLGEEATLLVGGVVVRTSAVYGVGPGRPNFGKVVVEKLMRGEEVVAIEDQWLSPTLNTLLGVAIAKLVGMEYHGIIHVAGPRMSRYEFALSIAEAFGLDRSLIKPAKLDEMSFKAPRPRDSSLDISRAEEMLGIPLGDIRQALSIFRKEYLEKGAGT